MQCLKVVLVGYIFLIGTLAQACLWGGYSEDEAKSMMLDLAQKRLSLSADGVVSHSVLSLDKRVDDDWCAVTHWSGSIEVSFKEGQKLCRATVIFTDVQEFGTETVETRECGSQKG